MSTRVEHFAQSVISRDKDGAEVVSGLSALCLGGLVFGSGPYGESVLVWVIRVLFVLLGVAQLVSFGLNSYVWRRRVAISFAAFWASAGVLYSCLMLELYGFGLLFFILAIGSGVAYVKLGRPGVKK